MIMKVIEWTCAVIFGASIGLPCAVVGFLFYYARTGFITGKGIAEVLDE